MLGLSLLCGGCPERVVEVVVTPETDLAQLEFHRFGHDGSLEPIDLEAGAGIELHADRLVIRRAGGLEGVLVRDPRVPSLGSGLFTDLEPLTSRRSVIHVELAGARDLDGDRVPDHDELLHDGSDPFDARSPMRAFPGAEGFGAFARGGRGGPVLFVTNLQDGGPGSLRAALETSGPRLVLFRVGGTIDLDRPLRIEEPYVTIAGQSAPGGGIALRNHDMGQTSQGLLEVAAHDVVIRHLRLRAGPGPRLDEWTDVDNLSILPGAHDVIVDHVSVSWSVDENLQVFGGVHDVTVQWSLAAEGLHCANHRFSLEPGTYGEGECATGGPPQSHGLLVRERSLDDTHPSRISIHHNLFASNDVRNPRIASADRLDLMNNVVHNHGAEAIQFVLRGNRIHAKVVGNTVTFGPSNREEIDSLYAIGSFDPIDEAMVAAGWVGPTGLYVYEEGNRAPLPMAGLITPRWTLDAWRAPVRHPSIAVSETSAEEARLQILAGAGATLPARDAADARIVAEVMAATGQRVDHPDDVGGWPSLAPGTPELDSDADGMPDAWELTHSLDPAHPADGAWDADVDGYSNVEEFLNATDPGQLD